MRRRLLAVILGSVTLALLIATVGSFLLIATNTRRETVESVRDRARALSQSQINRPNFYPNVRALQALDGLALLAFPDPTDSTTTPAADLSAADVIAEDGLAVPRDVLVGIHAAELRALVGGRTLSGVRDNTAWSLVYSETLGRTANAVFAQDAVPSNARQALGRLLAGSAIALAFAGLIAAVIARRLSAPLRAATAAYRRIAAGDLSVRVAERDSVRRRDDEIGELMRNLDVMAESLDRAQKQERQFLLSVSHDLRTPLTSIRGFSEALAEGTAPDPARAGEIIAAEARRLERLVRDLLDLAKLESHQFTLHLRRCDLTELVTDAADGFLPTAAREELTLTLDAVPDVVATVDADRAAQVLANLIENACKFAHSAVAVTLRAEPGPVIRVADDGPGIATGDLPYVFDRHYTSDRRTDRKLGSGLGLAITRELVQAMHGTITVETSPAGTTFVVALPAR